MADKIYTIHIEAGIAGCVLDAIPLRSTLGIEKIRFVSVVKAAVFAQRHANGDATAVLRVCKDGAHRCRPIPPPESWIPEEDADFHAAFVALPIRLFRMPNGCIFIPDEDCPLPGGAKSGKFVEAPRIKPESGCASEPR